MTYNTLVMELNDEADFGALALDVLRIEEGEITDITSFTSAVFPAFGLPATL